MNEQATDKAQSSIPGSDYAKTVCKKKNCKK